MAGRDSRPTTAANPSRPSKSLGRAARTGRPHRRGGRVDQKLDPLFAQTLDVHGAPGSEMCDALNPLRRTLEVGAEGVALTLEAAPEGCRSSGRWSGNAHGFDRFGPIGEHGPDHLGDDVAGLANDHGVARPDVFQSDLVLVVERREPDRRPATNTGSSTAKGVARPVRPMETSMLFSFVVRSSGGNL